MGADDNLFAGVTGLASGIKDVLKLGLAKKFEREGKLEDLLAEEESKRRLLKDHTASQIEIEKAKPRTMYQLITPTGELSGDALSSKPVLTGNAKQTKTIQQIEEEAAARARGTASVKPTIASKDQTIIDNAKAALSTLADLETSFATVPSGAKALGSRGISFVTGGAYGNKDQRTYEDALRANAAKFYRAYTGDVRLSNDDAQKRAYPLLPTAFMDKETGKMKYTDLKNKVIMNALPVLHRYGLDESTLYENNKTTQGGTDTGFPIPSSSIPEFDANGRRVE